MKIENHEDILKEVLDEILTAQKDKRGLVAHQRRLAFSLSLGAVNLLEIHLHNLNIRKEGSKINHEWFKRKEEHIKEKLNKQTTSPIESIGNIREIIEIMMSIEEKRDDLAYGAPAPEDVLLGKINEFFTLKGLLE